MVSEERLKIRGHVLFKCKGLLNGRWSWLGYGAQGENMSTSASYSHTRTLGTVDCLLTLS